MKKPRVEASSLPSLSKSVYCGVLVCLGKVPGNSPRIISRMVVTGADATEEQAERIYLSELNRVSRKFTHMRYHSFLMYFGVLKRLGWVELTSETEPSVIQDNYSEAPARTYYHLTKKGVEADNDLLSNPLFTLYPEIGASHMKKSY